MIGDVIDGHVRIRGWDRVPDGLDVLNELCSWDRVSDASSKRIHCVRDHALCFLLISILLLEGVL